MLNIQRLISAVIVSFVVIASTGCAQLVHVEVPPTTLRMYEYLKQKQFVDLTHAFEPGIPH